MFLTGFVICFLVTEDQNLRWHPVIRFSIAHLTRSSVPKLAELLAKLVRYVKLKVSGFTATRTPVFAHSFVPDGEIMIQQWEVVIFLL